ncbi:MAG: SDR family oxidoreductase [Deltaproteobacteria bacterium]
MGLHAVSGGASGIGAAIASRLRSRGDEVLVVDVKDAEVEADLSRREGCDAALERLAELAPDGLDGLVACAGLGPATRPVSLITRVNFFGAQRLVDGARRLVAKKKGAVVVISSNSAPMDCDQSYVDALLALDEERACGIAEELGDGHNAYAGSKQAITRWMRREAAAYAAQGIRMNAIAPGITRTAMTDSVYADAELGPAIKEFGETVPVGRLGQPDDIASAACFLLSDEASFACGSVFFIDGGHDAMLRPDEF